MTKTRSSSVPSVVLDEAVRQQIEELRANGELDADDTIRTEPRCYVCCQVESKELVNKLIAANLTNREIAESCAGINARRQEADDERIIDARNVWSHRKNHYNLDDPAKAAVRAIIERRAKDNNIDYVNGTGHIATPYAVMEVGVFNGLNSLVDAKLTPMETLAYAKTLHDYTSRDQGQQKMADLMFTMDRLIKAAEKYVPVEQRAAFMAEVDGRQAPMAVLTERVHEQARKTVKEFTAPRTLDEGDEFSGNG